MDKRMIQHNEVSIAVIHSDEAIISDAQSVLDLLMTIQYDDNCHRIVVNKEAFVDDFYHLSTGIAGEILQKISNYRKKLAIYGDFSTYKSKPLKDFIYESNRGNTVFFVNDEQTAIERLSSEI